MLHIFDMDGTLLPHTIALLELASVLGLTDELRLLEKRFATKEISSRQLAQLIFELWGIVDDKIVEQAFKEAPKLKNIKKVVADIHDGGGLAVVITLSPGFFAEHFKAYGFDYIFASEFPKTPDVAFNPDLILNPDVKPTIAKKLHEDSKLGNPAIIAYGDSMSDVPMFEQATVSVSVNGDHHLEELATHHYDGDDLWGAYKLVRQTRQSIQ